MRIALDLRVIPPETLRRGALRYLSLATHENLVETIFVDRVSDGLPELLIIERRLIDVPLQRVPASDGDRVKRDSRPSLDLSDLLWRNLPDKIDFPRQQPLDSDDGVRDIAKYDFVEIGLALFPVVGIAFEDDIAAFDPLLEHEGAGADRMIAEILTVFGGSSGRDHEAGPLAEEAQEPRRRLL